MPKEKVVKICGLIIEYGILAIVFFIPIIFDFTASSYNLDLYKIVVFRIILTVILFAYVTKILIENKLSFKGGNKIFLLISWLGLSFFISSLFSIHQDQSFWGVFSKQQGFYNFIHYLLFFALLILNLKEFKQVRRIIAAVVASASLVSLYGLAQYFNLDPWSWITGSSSAMRIFSSLGQPNIFGHYLILVLPFGLYALIFLAKNFWVKFLVGLAILAQLFCLVFTYSRAAWLGFLGSMGFLLLIWLLSERRKKLAFGFIALLFIGLITIIGLNNIRPVDQNSLSDMNLINRLKSIPDLKSGSNKIRLYYLASAAQEIKKANYLRLLVGYGPETLASVFIKYYQQDWGVYEAINTVPDRTHNWLFDQILALGVFGLAITLTFYIYLIYKAAVFLRAEKKFGPDRWLLIVLFSSLVGYFVNNLFSFSLLTVLVYLYLILAIAWFIINYQMKEKEINIWLTNFSKLLIWLSLLTVAVIFIWTNNINQIKAEIYYIKSLKSINLSDCPGVINNITKTISLSPNSNYYQEQYLSLLLNCFSSVDRATRTELREGILSRIALVDDKELYGIRSNMARAYKLFGFYLDQAYYGEAEKLYDSLITDFPYLTTAYEDLGKLRMMQADYQGAIEIYRRALEILPPLDHPYLNDQHRAQIAAIAVRLNEELGRAYFKTKNYDLALDYYKQGLAFNPYRATLYKNIADIYFVKDQLDQAIIWNERGLMLNPADYNWSLALSLLYRDKKDLIKAKEYLDQAIKLAPENQDLKNYQQELNK